MMLFNENISYFKLKNYSDSDEEDDEELGTVSTGHVTVDVA